jgi:asparagine synthase (glutamine-hydrolysing)
VRRFWGPYLAILCDRERDRVLIVRDPLGARACYVSAAERFQVLFTDLADWAELCALAIDNDYLRLFLAHPRFTAERTGLAGVSEILPGMLYCWERTRTRKRLLWAPHPPPRETAHLSFDEAARRLRESAEACGAAWAQAGAPIVHRLSGGFDSSAALACLVRGGANDIVCINERACDVPEGDEFEAAARVARHFGAPLQAIVCRADQADYRRLALAPATPKPSLADLSFADPNALEALPAEGLSVLTSGQGGDQVFSRRPLLDALADALRDGCAWSELKRIAMDSARLSGKPLAFLIGEAWAGAVRDQRAALMRAMAQPGEAASKARQEALELVLDHPWIAEVDHRGPARALRAFNFIDLNYYQRPTVLSATSIAAPVFAAQPMLETVLAIPPHLMQQGGLDRALARAAFGDLLPPSALARTRKGDTTRYFVRAIGANREYLRAILEGGALAGRGLVDAADVARDLAKPEGPAMFRLLTALVAEAWIGRIKALAPAR